jgi:hypothetical protein
MFFWFFHFHFSCVNGLVCVGITKLINISEIELCEGLLVLKFKFGCLLSYKKTFSEKNVAYKKTKVSFSIFV